MSAIEQEDITNTRFLIEPNPLYDFHHGENDSLVLQNTSQEISYSSLATTSTNQNQLVFNLEPSMLFLDRGVHLRLNMPLEFTRASDPVDEADAPLAITKNNYVSGFMENFNSFCYKQYAFLNALQSISLSIDNMTLTTTDVGEMAKITSRFYGETAHERLPASLPDLQDYPLYGSGATHQTIDLEGNDLGMVTSVISANDPFTSMANECFNSRIPAISFHEWQVAEKRKLRGSINGHICHIPFSLFGLQGVDTAPLVGAKSLTLKLVLRPNWERHIFASKGTVIESVKFDNARLSQFTASLVYRTHTAPTYVEEAHALTAGVPDYKLKHTICELQNTVHQVTFGSSNTQIRVPVISYKLKAIPKAIIIAATLDSPDGDDSLMTTPDLFARIDGVGAIDLCGKKTVLYDNPADLIEMSKAAGLNTPTEAAAYLCGFPLRLDTSSSLAARSNALIGSRQASNELRITNLTLSNVARAGQPAKYNIRVVLIMDGAISHTNGRFKLHESLLDADTSVNVEAHVSELYNDQVGGELMIGGSYSGGSFGSVMAAALPTLKKIGRGTFNIGKKFVTNKKFRNEIIDIFNGLKKKEASSNPGDATQPARVGSHAPMTAGYSNIIGGKTVGQLRF